MTNNETTTKETTNNNNTNIYSALSSFQNECPIIHKGTKGYGYSYADLPSIFKVINPLLSKNGLVFTQKINRNTIDTVVAHIETGQTIESSTEIPSDVSLKGMNDFQVLGSAVTYIRRYALSSILGIVTDVDNDASGQQLPKKKPSLNESRFSKAIEKVTEGSLTKEGLLKMLEGFELSESQKAQIKLI